MGIVTLLIACTGTKGTNPTDSQDPTTENDSGIDSGPTDPYEGCDEDEDGYYSVDCVGGSDCDDQVPYVFSGALEFRDGVDNNCNGTIDENNSLDEFILWASQNDYPSTTVSVLGTDLDRDSYAEIVVGDTEGNGLESRSGLAHLLYGSQEEITYQSLWGHYENDRFGSSLAYLDFSGEGTYKLAVGAKGNDDGGTSSGSVALFSSDSVLSGTDYDSAEVVWYGAEFTYAGSSLATSDSNHNQKAELLVGAYGLNGSTGRVYLLDEASLEDGALEEKSAQSFDGEQEDSQFGWALSGGADLDGDGMDDFAVGAPQYSHDETTPMTGAVYVYLGEDGSYPEVYQSIWYGEGAYDNVGFSLATGEDVDGDGYVDLLVGAPGNDDYGLDAGRAYLVAGGSSVASSQSLGEAKIKISGGTEAMQLGLNVAMAGDIDADGHGEVLLTGLVDDELDGVSAAYLFLGNGLETEITTGQADAVFVSDDENLSLVSNGIGHFDGQYYDSQGPYADFVVAYPDPVTNETLVHLMLGQETK